MVSDCASGSVPREHLCRVGKARRTAPIGNAHRATVDEETLVCGVKQRFALLSRQEAVRVLQNSAQAVRGAIAHVPRLPPRHTPGTDHGGVQAKHAGSCGNCGAGSLWRDNGQPREAGRDGLQFRRFAGLMVVTRLHRTLRLRTTGLVVNTLPVAEQLRLRTLPPARSHPLGGSPGGQRGGPSLDSTPC